MIEIKCFSSKYQDKTFTFISQILEELHPKSNLIKLPRYNDLKNISKNYKGRSKFWLLLDNDNVIGTIGVWGKNKEKAIIQRCYIHKNYRKRGYGTQLMTEVINFCKNAEFDYVNAITSKQSFANNLLKKFGFKAIEKDKCLIHYQLKLKNHE